MPQRLRDFTRMRMYWLSVLQKPTLQIQSLTLNNSPRRDWPPKNTRQSLLHRAYSSVHTVSTATPPRYHQSQDVTASPVPITAGGPTRSPRLGAMQFRLPPQHKRGTPFYLQWVKLMMIGPNLPLGSSQSNSAYICRNIHSPQLRQ